MYDELRYLRQLFWKILSTHPQNTRWTSDKLSGKYYYQIQDPRIHAKYCSTVYPLSSQLVLQIYVKKVKLHPNFNPNIVSEIIELQQNGASGGGNLTQIPHFSFHIGIEAQCYVSVSVKLISLLGRGLYMIKVCFSHIQLTFSNLYTITV